MKKSIVGFVIAYCGSVAFAQVTVQDQGFYASLSAGPTKIDHSSGGGSSGNGYKMGLGYDFNKYFALEGSYIGAFKQEERENGIKFFSNDRTAMQFTAIGKYPVTESFKLIGGLGRMNMTQNIYTDFNLTRSGTSTERKTNHNITMLGAEVSLDPRSSIRFETSNIGSTNYASGGVTGSYKGKMTHVGLIYKF